MARRNGRQRIEIGRHGWRLLFPKMRSFRVRLSSRGRWGCGVQRRWLGTLDQKPEHERQLPEDGGLSEGKHLVIILQRQYARKAQDHLREAWPHVMPSIEPELGRIPRSSRFRDKGRS